MVRPRSLECGAEYTLCISPCVSSPAPYERQAPAPCPRQPSSAARPPAHRRPRNRYATMMVQALLLLPRLVVTPPARLAVVPPHRAAVRRFTAPPVGGGRPARGAEPLLGTTSMGRASSSDAHGVPTPTVSHGLNAARRQPRACLLVEREGARAVCSRCVGAGTDRCGRQDLQTFCFSK